MFYGGDELVFVSRGQGGTRLYVGTVVQDMLKAGVLGYALKDGMADELVHAIRVVSSGISPPTTDFSSRAVRRTKYRIAVSTAIRQTGSISATENSSSWSLCVTLVQAGNLKTRSNLRPPRRASGEC